MLNKLKKTKSEGFTIIEVMIVLAIAGLIILIVLLAVPALQRNGRNTAMKNDASAVAAALSEYGSNNEGRLPTGVATTDGEVTVSGPNGTTEATAKVQGETNAVSGTDWPDDTGQIVVVFGSKCDGQAAIEASRRAAAVLYNVETASDVARQCIDA